MGAPGNSVPSASYPTTLATDLTLGVLTNSTILTLAEDIDADDMSLTILESVSSLPTKGILTINQERIRYNGVNTVTKVLTVDTRGFDGSTAAAHDAGDPVRFNIVAHHHNQMAAEMKAVQATLGATGAENFLTKTGTVVSTGQQVFDAGIKLNDSDAVTLGSDSDATVKYDPTTNKVLAAGVPYRFDSAVQLKAGPWFDIKAFGAVGDGATDDTAAIVAAVAAASAGGTVYFPSGTYNFTGLTIANNSINLVGFERRSVILRYTGSGTAITVTADNGGLFSGFRVTSSGSGVTGIKVGSSTAYTGYRYRIRDVFVDGFSGKCFHFANCEQSIGEGLQADGGTHGFYFDNSLHSGGALGIDNHFMSCRAINQSIEGWHVESQEASSFINCQALRAGSIQFNIVGTSRACRVVALDAETASLGTTKGLKVSGTEHNVSIHAFSLATGISLETATHCTVRKSKFTSVTTPVLADSASSNNIIEETGQYTVTLTGTDNYLTGKTTRAEFFDSRATSNGNAWASRLHGDTFARLVMSHTGAMTWGDGTGQDTSIFRGAANRIDVASGDSLRIIGGSTTARDALTTSDGMLWYNTDTAEFNFRENGVWRDLSSSLLDVTTQTANYSVLTTDDVVFADATSGTIIMTLPTAVGNAGRQFVVKKVDSTANAVIVDPTGAQTIDGVASRSLTMPNESITIVSDGSNYRVI